MATSEPLNLSRPAVNVMSPSHNNPNSTSLWLLLSVTAILAVSQTIVAQDDESKTASGRAGAITGRVVNESGQPGSTRYYLHWLTS